MQSFNKKTWALGVLTAILLIAVTMPALPFASASGLFICEGNFSNISEPYDDVLVETDKGCILKNVSIMGNVDVESGAIFTASHSSIGGNIQADEANQVGLSRATVGGNVVIKNMDYSFGIVNIYNTKIDGNLQIESNSGFFVIVRDSTIGGHLQLSKNTADEISVKFSTIGGDLQFFENVSDTMFGNMANNNIIDGDLIFFKNRAECVFDWAVGSFCYGFNMANQIIDNDIGGNLLSFENEVTGALFTKGNQVIDNDIDGNLQFFENKASLEDISNEDNKIGGNDIGGNLDCANKNSVIDFEGGNKFTDPNAQSGDCLGSPAIVEICHTGNNTLSVPVNSVTAHFAHGDVLGACEN